ncbi:glycosyltransferase [Desertihabitans brevis]|uniref:Hyaluronan synthase n=1 Tax=Desertihabitans brevis TaxID=2268447 RepID=A0A367YW86_9ACTN|nr:glycosyltransferase [Desertihabitans brevis]RCK69221.1 glycosyltransferase [Desertihabitans brevis]
MSTARTATTAGAEGVGVRPGVTRVEAKPLLAVLLFAGLAGLTAVLVLRGSGLSLYGALLLPLLVLKLVLSLVSRPEHPDNALRVGVVVTVYNEDAELLRQCLDSLRDQNRRPHRVVVVDDASTDPGARELARSVPGVELLVHPENRGKREALATGFRALEGTVDVYACIDSDARLEPQSLREGMRPFSNPRTEAVTGMVIPSNHDRNLLTRLVDVRYVNAFLIERGAYSTLGSVLCVCGVLALYRADMVHRNLAGFLTQRFLGAPAVVGDDRHLTNRALLTGEAVLAVQAVAHTAVPENVSHYLRQQARWGRSFFRESLWSLRHHTPRRPAWWLSLLELAQWMVFTSMLAWVLVVHPLVNGGMVLLDYLFFVAAMSLVRSVRYFDVVRPDQRLRSRLLTFAVTPLFGLLNLFVMIPMRVWSLATLRRSAWGTRSRIEVTAEPVPAVVRPAEAPLPRRAPAAVPMP